MGVQQRCVCKQLTALESAYVLQWKQQESTTQGVGMLTGEGEAPSPNRRRTIVTPAVDAEMESVDPR